MGEVIGEPVPIWFPPTGASHHCRVPGPPAVAVRVTVPVPQRVRLDEVGAEGTATTETVTEEVLVHPDVILVIVTVYVKLPVDSGVNAGLKTVLLLNHVAGVHTNVYGKTGQNAHASGVLKLKLRLFLPGAAVPTVPVWFSIPITLFAVMFVANAA